MGELRRHRSLFACIAILALLGNLAVGLLASNGSQRGPADWPSELLGEFVLCTAHGAQDSKPDEGPAPTGKFSSHCAICFAPAAFTLILAVAAAVLLAPLTNRWRYPLRVAATVFDRLWRIGLGSRAPPLPA